MSQGRGGGTSTPKELNPPSASWMGEVRECPSASHCPLRAETEAGRRHQEQDVGGGVAAGAGEGDLLGGGRSSGPQPPSRDPGCRGLSASSGGSPLTILRAHGTLRLRLVGGGGLGGGTLGPVSGAPGSAEAALRQGSRTVAAVPRAAGEGGEEGGEGG